MTLNNNSDSVSPVLFFTEQENCLNLNLLMKVKCENLHIFQHVTELYNFRLICIILNIEVDLRRGHQAPLKASQGIVRQGGYRQETTSFLE